MYIYLYLNLFTIFFPFIFSFDKRVHFYTYWRHLFPAMAGNAAVFITWDALFTRQGVWGFNPDYLLGLNLFGLPLEEVLFFVTVPYACVFIYEVLNAYVARDWLQPYAKKISWLLLAGVLVLGLLFLPRLYTSVTCGVLAGLLGWHLWLLGDQVLGRFYLAYLVHLLPFLLVNGVLTAIPIVWYADAYNLGIRLYTIPAEDTLYSMAMLLLTITAYEWGKRRNTKTVIHKA
ncbi:MAG: lycopene cyclase domain-containing protein [Adhaeribacter sp.]